MVPNGWKKLSLETVAEIRSGVAKGKSGLKDPITVPYLRVANVQDGHINLNEVKEIEIERNKLERYSLKFGDVLMNEGGDFDKLGRGDVWLGQIEPCLHQNHVFAVRPQQERLDSFFLAALAASNYGKTYFLSCAKRSTNLASINSSQIKEFPVLVPPLPEQKKIAQILSTWDQAITATEQLLANSQQQKKALMQQLLTGKKRLLDENGVVFSGEWKTCKLQSLVEISTSTSKSQFIVETGENFIIDMGSVSREGKLIPSKRTHLVSDFLKSGQLVMPKDDIGGGNIIGRVGLIKDDDKYILSDHVYALDVKNCDSSFLCYLINSYNVNKNLRQKANGTAQLGLGKADVLKQALNLPNELKEQQKIATVLSTADQEIEALQKKHAYLKQEKKALMQQLLTGKRRVKVDA